MMWPILIAQLKVIHLPGQSAEKGDFTLLQTGMITPIKFKSMMGILLKFIDEFAHCSIIFGRRLNDFAVLSQLRMTVVYVFL